MHTCPIDSYWSRQYSWEKVSAKNGLSSPYKSLNYHAHDVDHASRTRLSVEGDVAVSACFLSILTHASDPSSLSAITMSQRTRQIRPVTPITPVKCISSYVVRFFLGLRLVEQTAFDAQQLQEALSRIALGKPSGFAEVCRCKRPFEHAVASVLLEHTISVRDI